MMAEILLVEPKSMDAKEARALADHLAEVLGLQHHEVALGQDDFHRYYPFERSWQGWAAGAAARHARVVIYGYPNEEGRGARRVVRAARSARKPLCWWDGTLFYS